MTRVPELHQRRSTYKTLQRVITKFEADDLALARAAREALPDGSPRSWFGEGSHSGHGDPTASVAVMRSREDRKPNVAEEAFELVGQALDLLCQADSLRAKALPPVTISAPTQDWCTTCESAGVHTPRGTAKEVGKDCTECGWCSAFRRAHGCRAPAELILKHARGERIYDRDIVAALTRPHPNGRKRR